MKKLSNSRTSYRTDVKLDKKNTLASKKIENDINVVFSILGRFGAIQKSEFRRMVRDLSFLINNCHYLRKAKNRTKKLFNTEK